MFTVIVDDEFVAQSRSWLAETHFTLARSWDDVADYLAPVLRDGGDLGMDFEATGLNVWTDKVVGFSCSHTKNTGIYAPVRHFEGAEYNLPIGGLVNILQAIDAQPAIRQWWYNADYDHNLAWQDLKWRPTWGRWRDALLAVFLEYSDAPSHRLKDTVQRIFSREMIEYTEILNLKRGKGKIIPGFEVVHPLHAPPYACGDSMWTRELGLLLPVVKAVEAQAFIWDLEHKILGPVREGINHGIPADGVYLTRLHHRTMEEIRRLELSLKASLGVDASFNLRAREKLAARLIEVGVPLTDQTPTGQLSTSKKVIAKHAATNPFVKSLAAYAELASAAVTMAKLAAARTHFGPFIRLAFNTIGAPTGRMSSGGAGRTQAVAFRKGFANQNGQAIADPEKQPYLPDVRAGISTCELGNDDWVIVAGDYEQIELRIVANVTEEKRWREMFLQGVDIHAGNGALIETVLTGKPFPLERVTKPMRKKGKVMSFAIVYQATAKTVAAQAGIPEEEAQKIIDAFYGVLTSVNAWVAQTKVHAETHGFVQTPFGRRRVLKGYFAADRKYATPAAKKLRNAGHREGVNHPIQGGAADVFKIAIYKVHKALKAWGAEADWVPMMWVHDEMVSLVRRSRLYELLPKVQEVMEFSVRGWKVPIKVAMEVGWNWGAGMAPDEQDIVPTPFGRNWGCGLMPWDVWTARFPPETADQPVVSWLPARYFAQDLAPVEAVEDDEETDELASLFDDPLAGV